MSKRNRQPEELLIILAPQESAVAGQLVVDARRVRSCSLVAASLPHTESVCTWDLSNLRVGGRAVSRAAVVAWLNAIYKAISNCWFEEQHVCITRTATGLYEVLAFADAVDTEPGIVLCLLEHLDSLVFRGVGAQPVQLSTDGSSYCFHGMQLSCTTPTLSYEVGMPAGSLLEQHQLSMQVAEQLEALLYQAHTMQLQPLIRRLHCFIASNADSAAGTALLYGVLSNVFSQRVIEAALGPPAALPDSPAAEDARHAWITSVLTQRCGLAAGSYAGSQQLLKPIKLPSKLQAPISFEAELLQDWNGGKRGQKVAVELDLFDSGTVSIGETLWSVQLLLGPAASCNTAPYKQRH